MATIGPIGHVSKGGGSIAAAFAAVCWYLFNCHNAVVQIVAVIIVFIIGVWVSDNLEEYWGKDSNKIVIDEVLGMMVSLVFIPISVKNVVIAYLLFRFFDITKILGIKRSEKLPKGWGVMVDDLWAGIYCNLILQACFYYEMM
ncbi:phosphatidylglycerophosphatase A family protein [Chryseobacterium lathyri]|uniref:phosphatidylglycerophosphatase A family protein n=1 Tax=Chryseobacterium lathyri TaxID=395933 RepID=UPI00277F0ED2|nr:phosphatidylglycerophosphatase A [Chryseobacterium lathyri]MDQ0064213.1 phosphatidylglycerophosphatase A [Chryseobacterium lathyri]